MRGGVASPRSRASGRIDGGALASRDGGLNDKSSAVVLRCINQRARLLGLDAPAQVNVNLQDGEVVEVGVLQVLDEEHMEMALRLRDRVAAFSRLRGGASSCERPS